MSFIDVHVYDGKWNHDVKTRATTEKKQSMFNILMRKVASRGKPLDGIKLVVDSIQKEENYDNINKLYADDILYEICVKLLNSPKDIIRDTIDIIAEQMDDMYKLGQCAQGRTTRLIQIYKCL